MTRFLMNQFLNDDAAANYDSYIVSQESLLYRLVDLETTATSSSRTTTQSRLSRTSPAHPKA